jgi:hypothetical protein
MSRLQTVRSRHLILGLLILASAVCAPVSASAAGVITVNSPANGATVTVPFDVNFTYSAADTYTKLWIDGVAVTAERNGSTFDYTVTSLAAGKHVLALQAHDTSSNTTITTDVTITVSSASPATVNVTPSSVTMQEGSQLTFNSNVSANWSASGDGGIPTCSNTTSCVFTAGASAGAATLTATSAADPTISGTATIAVGNEPTPSGVYTYKYDNGRTGLNASETALTLAAVTNGANFGKLGTWTVDGSIYTQPLYVPGVSIGSGTYNVLYVCTENDSCYALNADVPGSVLWKRSFLTATATIGHGYTNGRTSIGANVGITGTPVIDPGTNWMYVVTRTTEGGQQVQRLHAIDIRTGADTLASTTISASVTGTGLGNNGAGQVPFMPMTQNQRPGLLLNNGIVFVTFASFSDNDPYHGWMMAYDATTLAFIDAYLDTPNGGGGGSWMAGAAPAGDSDGNVYFAAGNGRPDATAKFDPPYDLPNSFLKLKVMNGKLTLVDYFSPYNAQCLSADDLDLGSSGPTIIPDQFAGYNIIAIGSKEGRAYLLNQDDLGQFNAGSDKQILSSVLFNPAACGQAAFNANAPLRVYGSPAYWNGNIYFGSAFGPLRQYNITTGKLVQTALSAHLYPGNGQVGRGPLTIVSANGTTNAIVWTAENDLNGNGWLRAFDATDVGDQIYVTNYGPGDNFIIPTVINGNLYVSGHATLYKYGLLK